jgi:hypothetical protein
MPLRTIALTILLLCASLASHAVDVEGVRFEPSARVANTSLKLNGAGVRGRSFIKAYAIGLYLGRPGDTLDDAMAAPGSKRIEIIPLLDLPAAQFNKPLVKGLKKNLPPDEFQAMQPRIQAFSNDLLSLEEVRKGSRVALDWIPGRGTRIMVDGKETGTAVPGEDFYRGLLAIWIGPKPTQDDLKTLLLGGTRSPE